MKFLYPQFLYALIAVIIPVIIHLFNFQRHKKVYFSNVSFLKEVKQSTKAKSNLKHYLILVSRILAVIALVLAFTQPYFPLGTNSKKNELLPSSIFIDNSFSSQNKNEDGNLLDIQRELGFQLLNELPSHLNHQVISNDFTGAQQHLYSVTELNKKMEGVSTSSKSQQIRDVIKRQKSSFKDEKYSSVIISDFQKNQFDFSQVKNDSNIDYTLIPVSPNTSNNISIDSIWFDTPIHKINTEEKVHIRIQNMGDIDKEGIRVELELDNEKKGFITLNITANSFKDTLIQYHTSKRGWHEGELTLTDFPVVYDNSQFFSFFIRENIRVVEIKEDSDSQKIEKAFLLEPYFRYEATQIKNLDLNLVNKAHWVIVNQVTNYSSGLQANLKQFVEKGGHLTIVPSGNVDQISLNEFLGKIDIPTLANLNTDTIPVTEINLTEKLFQGVFEELPDNVNLPILYKSWYFPKQTESNNYLNTTNQQSFLSGWNFGQGKVYIFSSSFNNEFSNFSKHSLFLPTLYQMAFNSGKQRNTNLIIGQNETVQIPDVGSSNELIFHVKNQQNSTDFIPEIIPTQQGLSLNFHKGISQSGNYRLTQNDSLIAFLSFNYDRLESDLKYYSVDELTQQIDSLNLTNFQVFSSDPNNFSDDYKKKENGIELWRWFIFFTLLFLAFEIILIRYFKPSVL